MWKNALTVIAQPGKLSEIVEEGLVNTLPGCTQRCLISTVFMNRRKRMVKEIATSAECRCWQDSSDFTGTKDKGAYRGQSLKPVGSHFEEWSD
jgi:hypothetical protein